VAAELGNTASICKKCYVHPAVLEAYESGVLQVMFRHSLSQARRHPVRGLSLEERATLALLEQLQQKPARAA
jgi:DNA topoisomerase-1